MMDALYDDQLPFVLGESKLARLRTRHKAAREAMSPSFLSFDRSSQVARVASDDDEWLSDEAAKVPTMERPPYGSSTFGKASRASFAYRRRRQSSSHPLDLLASPPIKRPNNCAGCGRKSTDKGEHRWISLLERNTEELMSQIETLTGDAAETETQLKSQLRSAQDEVAHLREQLAMRERALKSLQLHSDWQNKHYQDQRVQRQNSAIPHFVSPSSARQSEVDSNSEMGSLTRERDLLRARAKKKDDELTRSKRRNAELAEQIIQKRELEM